MKPELTGEQSLSSIQSALPGLDCTPDRRVEIVFRQITAASDSSRASFVDIYRKAFAGPPYFEQFSEHDVVEGVWEAHLNNSQCVLVAEVQEEEGPRVVALACAHALISPLEPSIKDFVLEQVRKGEVSLDPNRTLFVSELATADDYRGHGLGTKLTVELFKWGKQQGFQNWATRTAAEGSNSLRIFQRCQGQIFGPRQDVSDQSVESRSKERVYLVGLLDGFSRD